MKKEKNTSYLRKFNDDIVILADKYGLNPEEAESLVDSFFIDLKNKITDPRMPTLKITNLGTFKPSIGKIDWQIKRSLRAYRAGKIDRARITNKIAYLWPIKQRLIKEKLGIITWKDWRHAQK